MKKKILAILMTALMVVSLIPMFAFTALANGEHDLTVTKNDEAAVEGTDYQWEYDNTQLTILKNGLTVSGSTSTEKIRFDNNSVNNLTIKGLSITLEHGTPINLGGNNKFTLTLVGNNTITTNGELCPYNGVNSK